HSRRSWCVSASTGTATSSGSRSTARPWRSGRRTSSSPWCGSDARRARRSPPARWKDVRGLRRVPHARRVPDLLLLRPQEYLRELLKACAADPTRSSAHYTPDIAFLMHLLLGVGSFLADLRARVACRETFVALLYERGERTPE